MRDNFRAEQDALTKRKKRLAIEAAKAIAEEKINDVSAAPAPAATEQLVYINGEPFRRRFVDFKWSAPVFGPKLCCLYWHQDGRWLLVEHDLVNGRPDARWLTYAEAAKWLDTHGKTLPPELLESLPSTGSPASDPEATPTERPPADSESDAKDATALHASPSLPTSAMGKDQGEGAIMSAEPTWDPERAAYFALPEATRKRREEEARQVYQAFQPIVDALSDVNRINSRWFRSAHNGSPELGWRRFVDDLGELNNAPAEFFAGLTKILSASPTLVDKWQEWVDWIPEQSQFEGPITRQWINDRADELKKCCAQATGSDDPNVKWNLANRVAGIANQVLALAFHRERAKWEAEQSEKLPAGGADNGEEVLVVPPGNEPDCAPLKSNVVVGCDESNYIFATRCKWGDIDTLDKLKGIIKREGIRTINKPRRLLVHAADWQRYIERQERAVQNALDEERIGDFVEGIAERKAAIRARKAKKGPPGSNPTRRLLGD